MRRISEILQEERLEKNYSLSDIEKAIKIRKEFLIAIEAGEFNALPSESYALGFVKNYAQFLGIDETKAAALFRREFESRQKSLPTFKSRDNRLSRKLLLTPKSFLISIAILIVVTFIAYQFSSFFVGPKLEILSPKEGQIVEKNITDVKGKTDPYASVTVNSEDVYIKLDGSFKKTLYLFEGKRQIVIMAKNRNGKETKKIVDVVVK